MKDEVFEGLSAPSKRAYAVIPLKDFLSKASSSILIDVRSPKEYAKGHIHGAVNIPLFTDDERAEIGTLYVRKSRKAAIERGFEIVGPKMIEFIREVNLYQKGQNLPLCIYCWRGGMRSNSMAWLMNMCGFEVSVLDGGYKSYRKGLTDLIESNTWKLRLLGGMTGCGKTDVLHAMRQQGAQVLDLEMLAEHKGSAFGHLGMIEQPTTESFENRIFHEMLQFDPAKVVWIEAESKSIGSVFIPDVLFTRMRVSTTLLYEIPEEERLDRLCKDYGCFDIAHLEHSFQKIEKRLGYDQLKIALAYLADNNLREAARIALRYYDKCYQHCFDQKKNTHMIPVFFNSDSPVEAAEALLNQYND